MPVSIQAEQLARTGGKKYGLLPKADLVKYRQAGMSRQDIVDEVYRRTGYRISLEAVSMAAKRAGLGSDARRYDELIPWRVKEMHGTKYPLTMLRLEARRRAGFTMTPDQAERLHHWLERLEKDGKVVYYEPRSPDGFYYVDRLPEDTDIIRKPDEDEADRL